MFFKCFSFHDIAINDIFRRCLEAKGYITIAPFNVFTSAADTFTKFKLYNNHQRIIFVFLALFLGIFPVSFHRSQAPLSDNWFPAIIKHVTCYVCYKFHLADLQTWGKNISAFLLPFNFLNTLFFVFLYPYTKQEIIRSTIAHVALMCSNKVTFS